MEGEMKRFHDKEAWRRIVERGIAERFASVKILGVFSEHRSTRGVYVVARYRIDFEGGGTEFGVVEASAEDLEAIFREDRISQIIE